MSQSQQPQRSIGAPRIEDDAEEEEVMPFQGIVKSAVLQECREFSAVTISTTRCRELMTRVLYLLYTGVTMSAMEATDVFFGATKLFQNDSPKLRRLLYVLLKELSPIAEQVFIASSSLMKDISGNNEANRCNAIRTLRKVLDIDMVNAVERYLQQALVDQSNAVVSAAIVTGLHLSYTQPDTVKRWSTQVADALKNRGSRVQYLALPLLHKIRRNDRLSVQKLVQQVQNAPQMLAPLALCVLVRMCTELMQEDFQQSEDLYRFVVNMTHHTSDMVVFEAAKSIVSLRNVTGREVAPAVVVVGFFLTAHKPVLRFAAVRLMSQVATLHPTATSSISSTDVEGLLNDPNKSVVALATTTLLKTGNQWSVVRLVKQLTSPAFFELTDDYKGIIVESMQVLVAKFPERHQDFIDFLFFTLRDGGTAAATQNSPFKSKVLDSAVAIMQVHPTCKEYMLHTIAEYLEDCPVVSMVERGMCLLGDEVTTCREPKKFVRLIYNHVMLESPIIRAAAVTTLAKVAAAVPTLRRDIAVLLRRTLADPDDEVRDRAMLYWKLLTMGDEVAIQTLITQVANNVAREQAALLPAKAPLDRIVEAAAVEALEDRAAAEATGASLAVVQLRDRLQRVTQLRQLGLPLRTVEPALLTDTDNEFVVAVAKHVFATHVVLQYKVTNTMEVNTLHHITISTDVSELEAEPQFATSIAALAPGATDYCYVVLLYEPPSFPCGTVRCSCAFAISEGDDAPGDVEDYPLDEFAINVSDYIEPVELTSAAFESQWTSMREAESSNTYALPGMRNLTVAAHEVCDFFGMAIVGGRPEKVSTKSHTLNLTGRVAYRTLTTVLISAKVFIATDNTVALTLSIRGADEELRGYLSSALMS